MSGVKHTPWERLVGYAEPGHPIYKPGTEVIRIVEKRALGQTKFVKVALVDSGHANASLIAAAPDFFDHAKSLVEAWDARTTGAQQIITGKSDRELQKQAMEAIDGLRAALVRARGEQDVAALADDILHAFNGPPVVSEEAPAEAGEEYFSPGMVWEDQRIGRWIADVEEDGRAKCVLAAQAMGEDEDQAIARRELILSALRAQPPAREDAQPVAWRRTSHEQPLPGHKIVTLYDDGSGAALLFVHDGGVIDCDGDDYEKIGSAQTWWAYLPDGFEFACEGYPEDPVTLPAHRVPTHPAPDALRVAVDDALHFYALGQQDAGHRAKQALAALQAEQGAK